MNYILKGTVSWFYAMGQKVLHATGYNLIVVEEEAVPLAAGDMMIGNNMLPFVLFAMGALFIISTCVMYWLKCRQYRLRIKRLSRESEPVQVGWNLSRLKETVSELEWKMAGK